MIEDPGCLWARVLKGPGVQPDSPEEYENLKVKMNLFYHEVNLDVQKLKPAELKEGLVCVVFSLALKSWCRAVVESVFQGTVDTQAWCLLVDHGDRIIVGADDVRTPLEKFLQLPFRVRRFKLAGICPMTLQVPISENTAELVPSSTWDSSATKYLHNLLQGMSTLVEAVLCETQAGFCAIELYLTINNTKICVNHELVAKKFACFMSEKSSTLKGNRNGDRAPVSLAWDIYSSPQQLLEMKGCCPVKAPPPDILIRKEQNDDPQDQETVVFSHSEKQKPQESEEAFMPSQVNPQVSKLTRNAGTDTIGRGWRIRAEATDIFTDKHCGQTDAQKLHASDSSEEQKVAAVSQEPSLEDQLTSSRLMQFLNPDPLNPEQESLDAKVVRCDPGHSGVLVHAALRVEPCSNLTRAPISEKFRKFLLWRKYNGPNVAESYCWPAVARGFDTVLVSHSGDNPLSYIPPLLMLLQTVSVVSSLAARAGPIAVILCPGWEKVQTVLELLEDSKATYNLHPTSVLLGVDQEEPKKFKIQRNCQLLVTTPFTMTRLLDAQCFLFLRLCHLVLDEADVLYSQAPEQMSVILKHFQKVVSGEERSRCPRQIIAVGSRWSAGIEGLVREHMIYPSIIITVMEEAALYGRVHQRVQLCLDCDKISVLLSSLDFHPPKPQKTLIITNSAEETEHVYKAVVNTAVFTLKAHEDLTDQFDFVIDQWRKDIGHGTQVILVTTNDCLKALGIRDATCVVHYGFPTSPKLFGSRLFCLSENFRNLSDADHAESSSPAAQSVLLLSEQNARHVCGVLRYEVAQLSMDDVHLIGYSLGAHVAGFAGSHFRGLRKVGRITGLDPAAPHFEGLPAFDRLSPDDAQFVDAIHTFTGNSFMPGVGIKQSVAHVDFYPNGGSFQPGCKMLDIYSNVFQYGLEGVPKTIKCAHERAVKLFTDSLVNASQPIIGYRCRDDSTFNKGLCLDCKQMRCNTLGFDVRRERAGRNAKGLYLRTGPQVPYRVFHYQIRVLLKNLIEPVEASLSVTLNGTGGESPELPIILMWFCGASAGVSRLRISEEQEFRRCQSSSSPSQT
ncbi:ATP-dependent RNA helicase TDRD12 [Labeo rohita]|uniref:RNA helicase n=1 Tax=Labeo rohita TaxID=84645 RepID=A0A498NRZ3_LABRO|nr:ATP-dependent RNA helicase TDRD12 [Labeo rohita]